MYALPRLASHVFGSSSQSVVPQSGQYSIHPFARFGATLWEGTSRGIHPYGPLFQSLTFTPVLCSTVTWPASPCPFEKGDRTPLLPSSSCSSISSIPSTVVADRIWWRARNVPRRESGRAVLRARLLSASASMWARCASERGFLMSSVSTAISLASPSQ